MCIYANFCTSNVLTIYFKQVFRHVTYMYILYDWQVWMSYYM
jgi:hypothetical protein